MTVSARMSCGHAVEGIVGSSPWARRIRADILRAADCSASVLVTGPTGTGKELIASAIHAESPRAARLFIPVDCAAIQGGLFASQLFGHVKGAFTGASSPSLGYFRAADGGTLFLDEVGELEPESQAKILRAIQERTVVPVGSYEGILVDVRIIAATNRDLAEEVGGGRRFREDLYYRLNVVSLRTEPLKDRPEDIEALAEYFLEGFATQAGLPRMQLSADALELLQRCPWPGNVRQLQNLLERAVIYNDGSVIDVRILSTLLDAARPADEGDPHQHRVRIHLPPEPILRPSADARPVRGPSERESWRCRGWTLAEVEREHIMQTLIQTSYNQTVCARLLKIDRHRLTRKIIKYQIPIPLPRRGRHPLLLNKDQCET